MAIRDRLTDLALDVVLLQEVDLWTSRVDGRHVARELFETQLPTADPWAWAFGPSLQSEPVHAGEHPALYGNLVAVRGRLDECMAVDLGPSGSDPVLHSQAPHQERRSAVLARVQTRGRCVVVASAHLRYGNGQALVRKSQTIRLLALLDHFARPDDVVVLAADFNAQVSEMESWALPPVWRRGTPSAAPPVESATIRHGVDHFLVRGAVISDVCSLPSGGLSDHLPMVLTLA